MKLSVACAKHCTHCSLCRKYIYQKIITYHGFKNKPTSSITIHHRKYLKSWGNTVQSYILFKINNVTRARCSGECQALRYTYRQRQQMCSGFVRILNKIFGIIWKISQYILEFSTRVVFFNRYHDTNFVSNSKKLCSLPVW